MSTYSYGDGYIYYQAMVRGDLANGPGAADWWDAQSDVYAAAHTAIPFDHADFHIVAQYSPQDEPAAVRWQVSADTQGPMPTWETDDTVPALMLFRLITTADDYPRANPDKPLAYGADMQDVLTAALARVALGDAPVSMPMPGHADMTFTPKSVEYSQNLWTPVLATLDLPLVGYAFTGLPPSEYYVPSMWVVPAGRTNGPLISACYDSTGTRWDDPDRPTPVFNEVAL